MLLKAQRNPEKDKNKEETKAIYTMKMERKMGERKVRKRENWESYIGKVLDVGLRDLNTKQLGAMGYV